MLCFAGGGLKHPGQETYEADVLVFEELIRCQEREDDSLGDREPRSALVQMD